MREKSKDNFESRVFQTTVTAAGLLLWGASVADIAALRASADQLTLLALVPLAIIVGMFPITFPLPSGLKFTTETISFTLSDAFTLLVACRYGVLPAVFLAGLEGFLSSRASVRRLSSNLFSSGMMSLAAGAASSALAATLAYASAGPGSFTAVACALLVASIVQLAVNVGLLSTLIALRHGDAILPVWRKNFVWAVAMFLPTSTAASLMYLALQSGFVVVLVIGAPVLLTVYLLHRQYRDSVRSRIETLAAAHRQTVEALAVAINAKDEVTHEHVTRVQTYAAGVARLLGCTDAEVEALRAGALLHDIGKIAVPDCILNKPGKLTVEEFNQMKLHTVVGAQILSRVEFPFPVVPVVRHHHERWDGHGYPDGLKGEEIPLTARILSVVDCFDAVREDRPYRRGMTREQAVGYVLEESGKTYDPQIVATFLAHLPEFEAEIEATRAAPAPTFGIEAAEQLSGAALAVAPAAGLAEDAAPAPAPEAAHASEERALYDLAAALAACRTEDEKCAAFVGRLGRVVPADTCALVRISAETGESRVALASGRNASLLEGRVVRHGSGVTGWVLANLKPLFNSDPKLDLPEDAAAHFKDYRTLAVAPVADDGALFGAIALYSATLHEYDARHGQLLCEAANIFARSLVAGLEETRAEVAAPQPRPQRFAVTTLESSLTH
ncbi:MAG TPA: HD domain-containing phosphohydrolase [Pyrinomonadaceae bacterium]|jgi:putative nucleotidyltransferase with HDIG domain|nr:HD domain-containing phosphohydrolase [Pyrinomonadaceae bacterium]